jgi:hypothetical protein
VHSIEELSLEHQQKVMSKAKETEEDFGGITGGRSDGEVNHPTTPRSASTQPTDSADAISKKALYD